jgi:deoxyribose-phosphate aldolase
LDFSATLALLRQTCARAIFDRSGAVVISQTHLSSAAIALSATFGNGIASAAELPAGPSTKGSSASSCDDYLELSG